MSSTEASGITDHKYVSFTTFRRNGTPVSTPVWIASLGGKEAGFTTDLDSGKVKRLRNNTAVTLRPCDARGRVPADALTVEAIAAVVTGADTRRVRAAIRAKYPVLGTLLGIGATISRIVRRSAAGDAAIVVTLP